MKKLIFILLSVAFIFGIVTVGVYADAYDLTDYGQKEYFTGARKTPKLDGKVSEGEYSLVLPTFAVANDASNDDFYIVQDGAMTAEKVNIYVAQDASNIYFAVEEKDSTITNYVDCVYFHLACSDAPDTYLRVYLPHCALPEFLSESDIAFWANNYNAASIYDENTGVVTYEMALSREAIAKKFGVEKDFKQLLVNIAVRTAFDNSGEAYVIWGFENDELVNSESVSSVDWDAREKHPTYPHVLYLYDENNPDQVYDDDDSTGEEQRDYSNAWELGDFGQIGFYADEKIDNAPVADGKVEDGEYNFEILDLISANNSSDDRFFIVDSLPSVEWVNVYISYDDDYLYLAAEVKDTDIAERDKIYFNIGCNKNDIADAITLHFAYDDLVYNNYIQDGRAAVDGDVITYEMIVRRSDLADYAGVDVLDQMYFRVVVADDVAGGGVNANAAEGELWLAFAIPSNSPVGLIHPVKFNRYPHVLYLTDNTPTDTDSDTSVDTDAVTDAPVTDDGVTEEKGCGSSIAAVGAALVAALGTCTVFVTKKKY